MFDTVVDPAAVSRAYTVPLDGATDAIKFYETVAARRRKLQQDAADTAKDEQLKTAQALQQLSLKNFGTGTALDQATAQIQKDAYPQIMALAKKDPVQARYAASNMANQLESIKEYGTRIKTSAADAANSVYANNSLVDKDALAKHLLTNTIMRFDENGNPMTDADGRPVFNLNATGVNWGGLNPNDPHSLYPFTSRPAVEKALPGYLDQRFPKGEQTLYKDQVTGQPFTDALGRQIGKDVKMSPYQVYSNGQFQTAAHPSPVEGDTLANVYTPEQLQQMTLGGGIQQPSKAIREQLGRIPTLPDDVLHTFVSGQEGQYALLHKIDDIHQDPKRYFGKNGDKIVKAMTNEQLTGYAGYDLVNTLAPKGGNAVKDNTKIADERDQKAQQAFSNQMQMEHLNLARQSAARSAEKDPNGQSGYAIPTGQVGQDGKPIVEHLTNKALKETNDAMESIPGMWFKALGGGGPKAQAEAINHLPAPVSFAGSKWIPLSTGRNKADYLTDPITQNAVQVFYDPLFKGGGRVAVVPMLDAKDKDGKKTDGFTMGAPKFYTGADMADFMHTYGPQSIKGGEVKYDRLAPFVNQAFKKQ